MGHWSHFNHSGFRTHGLRRRHLSSRGSGLCCVVLLNHPPSSAIDAFSGCFHTLNWLWWGALLFIVSECIYDSLAAVKKKSKEITPPPYGEQLTLCIFLTSYFASSEFTRPSFKTLHYMIYSCPVNLPIIINATYTGMPFTMVLNFLKLCHKVLHSFADTAIYTAYII